MATHLRSLTSYRFVDVTESSSLYLVSAVVYLLGALSMSSGVIFWKAGMNPRWVLFAFTALLVAIAVYACQRGMSYTVAEAEAALVAGLLVIAMLSFTTHLPVGALRNGLGMPLLGAYAGWFLRRRGITGFYVGLAAWLLAVWSHGDESSFTIAAAIALETVVGVEVVRLLVQRLHAAARIDRLTGVLNRLGLDEAGAHFVREARRRDRSLSLALIDLDDLRSTNNTFGHAAGDALLKTACEEWLSGLPRSAVVGRIGGDEFVILLPSTTPSQAAEQVGALKDTASVRWTAGIAELEPYETFEEFVRRADEEMYAHKWH